MYDNLPFVFGYFLCYCLTTVLLRVTVLRNVATPVLPVVAGFLGVIAWLIPSLIAFFVEHNLSMLIPWYLLGSPVVLTTDDPNVKNVAGVLVLIWLIPCLVLSAPWFIGQWRRFAPYQTQPAGTTEA